MGELLVEFSRLINQTKISRLGGSDWLDLEGSF